MFFADVDRSLQLRNQVTTQERRATELSTANALLQKTLVEVRTCKTEIQVDVATLCPDMLVAHARETTLSNLA